MHLSELLNEDAISLKLRARDKESAIKELVQLLESAHHRADRRDARSGRNATESV